MFVYCTEQGINPDCRATDCFPSFNLPGFFIFIINLLPTHFYLAKPGMYYAVQSDTKIPWMRYHPVMEDNDLHSASRVPE